MSASNDCRFLSDAGVMVYLCNLDHRGFLEANVMGHAWDVGWQEAAQGTLLVIIIII